MEKVTIEIKLTNDAFQPYPEIELARILKTLAKQFHSEGIPLGYSPKIFDINGNSVGLITVEE